MPRTSRKGGAPSATIHYLPTAQLAPVQNPRRRGPFPRGVASMAMFRRARLAAQLRSERALAMTASHGPGGSFCEFLYRAYVAAVEASSPDGSAP